MTLNTYVQDGLLPWLPLLISKTTSQNWMKFWLQVDQNISEIFTNFYHKMSNQALCMSAARCQLMENIYQLQLKSQLTERKFKCAVMV